MLDIAQELSRWLAEGREFSVATVVGVSGSAPRGLGAALAVDREGTAVGSVSGGCVEGAVHDLCTRALKDGRTVVERFGYSDADAFAVGLTRGGIIDILVTPVTADASVRTVFRSALAGVARNEPAALTQVIRGPAELLAKSLLVRPDGTYEGTHGDDHAALARTAAAQAHAVLDAGRTSTVDISASAARWGSPGRSLGEDRSAPAASPCSSR